MKLLLQILLILSASSMQLYGTGGGNANICSNFCGGGKNISCRGSQANCGETSGGSQPTQSSKDAAATKSSKDAAATKSSKDTKDDEFIGPRLPDGSTGKKDDEPSLLDKALAEGKKLLGLNVVKERVSWPNINSVPIRDEGIITTVQSITVQFPSVGHAKIIRFTPSKGLSKNRYIEVLLASFDLKKANPKAIPAALNEELNDMKKQLKKAIIKMPYVVKIYSRRQGEREWYDHEEMQSDLNPNSAAMNLPLVIEPNGVIRIRPRGSQVSPDGSTGNLQEVVVDFAQLT